MAFGYSGEVVVSSLSHLDHQGSRPGNQKNLKGVLLCDSLDGSATGMLNEL